MEWVRKRYGVPAKRGGRVLFRDKPGRITAAKGGYLRVMTDDGRYMIVHPRWQLTYLDAEGQPTGPEPIR